MKYKNFVVGDFLIRGFSQSSIAIQFVIFLSALFGGFLFFSNIASAATYISGTISTNTTWTAANSPYVVSSVTVNSGVTLTIEPATVVKFQSTSSSLLVIGTLNVNGTSADKVYFTSIKDDAVGGDTNGDGSATTSAARDWSYIWVGGGTLNLNYAVVRYGGFYGSNGYGVIHNNTGSVNIANS